MSGVVVCCINVTKELYALYLFFFLTHSWKNGNVFICELKRKYKSLGTERNMKIMKALHSLCTENKLFTTSSYYINNLCLGDFWINGKKFLRKMWMTFVIGSASINCDCLFHVSDTLRNRFPISSSKHFILNIGDSVFYQGWDWVFLAT